MCPRFFTPGGACLQTAEQLLIEKQSVGDAQIRLLWRGELPGGGVQLAPGVVMLS